MMVGSGAEKRSAYLFFGAQGLELFLKFFLLSNLSRRKTGMFVPIRAKHPVHCH